MTIINLTISIKITGFDTEASHAAETHSDSDRAICLLRDLKAQLGIMQNKAHQNKITR